MLMVFPIPKSFGENHSFTSCSDTSITPAGKLAEGGSEGGREGGRGGKEGGQGEGGREEGQGEGGREGGQGEGWEGRGSEEAELVELAPSHWGTRMVEIGEYLCP